VHSGARKPLTDPQGMSGCPVFWVQKVAGAPAPDTFIAPVVAVFTENRIRKICLLPRTSNT